MSSRTTPGGDQGGFGSSASGLVGGGGSGGIGPSKGGKWSPSSGEGSFQGGRWSFSALSRARSSRADSPRKPPSLPSNLEAVRRELALGEFSRAGAPGDPERAGEELAPRLDRLAARLDSGLVGVLPSASRALRRSRGLLSYRCSEVSGSRSQRAEGDGEPTRTFRVSSPFGFARKIAIPNIRIRSASLKCRLRLGSC